MARLFVVPIIGGQDTRRGFTLALDCRHLSMGKFTLKNVYSGAKHMLGSGASAGTLLAHGFNRN